MLRPAQDGMDRDALRLPDKLGARGTAQPGETAAAAQQGVKPMFRAMRWVALIGLAAVA